QAEDGIRDYKVTGVQTCALPILGQGQLARYVTTLTRSRLDYEAAAASVTATVVPVVLVAAGMMGVCPPPAPPPFTEEDLSDTLRSEERRVGKECRCWTAR